MRESKNQVRLACVDGVGRHEAASTHADLDTLDIHLWILLKNPHFFLCDRREEGADSNAKLADG